MKFFMTSGPDVLIGLRGMNRLLSSADNLCKKSLDPDQD